MKRLLLISLAGIAILIVLVTKGRGTRSPTPGDPPATRPAMGFDPAESVALFVGARTFSEDDSLEKIPYAVDDAVDLAYTFAIDPRVRLVYPRHVVLALSDETPRKEISQRRLAELKRQGATVEPASHARILKLLSRQGGAVGPRGMFIVSFATHGFSEDGSQYLLAADSLFREFSMAIPAARIFDDVAKSRATRSLILIDACRERVRKQRAGLPEELSAAPLIRRMGLTEGQVVLYAAAAGKWAYDDDARQQGVFTGAVLEGLQCHAGRDRGGMVTVDTLSATVEQSVLTWIRANRDPLMRNATQANFDGGAGTMPLAICGKSPPSDPPPASPDDFLTLPRVPRNRASLRQPLEYCRDDGKALFDLYDSYQPDRFVTAYLSWRDGCVSVLRDLDDRLPQRESQENETNQFLAIANFWCGANCPKTLSAGNCALFQESPRARRCFWDLYNAIRQIEDVLIRNATALEPRDSLQGATE